MLLLITATTVNNRQLQSKSNVLNGKLELEYSQLFCCMILSRINSRANKIPILRVYECQKYINILDILVRGK